MLLFLQLHQSLGFDVNVLDLALAISVELHQLLAGRGVRGFFKVRGQSAEETGGSVGDPVRVVGCLGTVGGMEFMIELGQGVHETCCDATGRT